MLAIHTDIILICRYTAPENHVLRLRWRQQSMGTHTSHANSVVEEVLGRDSEKTLAPTSATGASLCCGVVMQRGHQVFLENTISSELHRPQIQLPSQVNLKGSRYHQDSPTVRPDVQPKTGPICMRNMSHLHQQAPGNRPDWGRGI